MIYLTSLYVLLNLDTEVSSFDRERVLRSLRERTKSTFGQSVTVRTDDDSALVFAFLEDSVERAHSRAEAVLTRLEEAGEARILSSMRQVFAWVDGEFRELEHERDYDDTSETSAGFVSAPSRRLGGRTERPQRDEDEHADEDNLVGDMTRRTQRRNMRLPVRK